MFEGVGTLRHRIKRIRIVGVEPPEDLELGVAHGLLGSVIPGYGPLHRVAESLQCFLIIEDLDQPEPVGRVPIEGRLGDGPTHVEGSIGPSRAPGGPLPLPSLVVAPLSDVAHQVVYAQGGHGLVLAHGPRAVGAQVAPGNDDIAVLPVIHPATIPLSRGGKILPGPQGVGRCLVPAHPPHRIVGLALGEGPQSPGAGPGPPRLVPEEGHGLFEAEIHPILNERMHPVLSIMIRPGVHERLELPVGDFVPVHEEVGVLDGVPGEARDPHHTLKVRIDGKKLHRIQGGITSPPDAQNRRLQELPGTVSLQLEAKAMGPILEEVEPPGFHLERGPREPDLLEGRHPQELPLPPGTLHVLDEDPRPQRISTNGHREGELRVEAGQRRVLREHRLHLPGKGEGFTVLPHPCQLLDLSQGLGRPKDPLALLLHPVDCEKRPHSNDGHHRRRRQRPSPPPPLRRLPWQPRQQRLPELPGRSEPLVPLEGQGLGDGLVDLRRNLRTDLLQGSELPQHLPAHHRLQGAFDGGLPSQHLVEHTAQGVDVCAGVQIPLPAGLLRAHIDGAPQGEARLGQASQLRLVQSRGDAEVRHYRMAAAEEHITGLDVPVDHALPVGRLQSLRYLGADPHCLLQWEPLLSFQECRQALALHPGHHVVGKALDLARVDEGEDIGMLELGDDVDLPQEPLRLQGRRQRGLQDLDGHLPLVSEVPGQVHHRHPTPVQLRFDFIAIGQGVLQAGEEIVAHGSLPKAHGKWAEPSRRARDRSLRAGRGAARDDSSGGSDRSSCGFGKGATVISGQGP